MRKKRKWYFGNSSLAAINIRISARRAILSDFLIFVLMCLWRRLNNRAIKAKPINFDHFDRRCHWKWLADIGPATSKGPPVSVFANNHFTSQTNNNKIWLEIMAKWRRRSRRAEQRRRDRGEIQVCAPRGAEVGGMLAVHHCCDAGWLAWLMLVTRDGCVRVSVCPRVRTSGQPK